MTFSYDSILFFIYFFALFTNPHASPSYYTGSPRITKLPLPLFKDSLVSTMELVQYVTSTISQIHGADDDPNLNVNIQHCVNFLGETAGVLNRTLSFINQEYSRDSFKGNKHSYTIDDVISHARKMLNGLIGSQQTCMEVLNDTRYSMVEGSLKEVTASISEILHMLQVPQGSPNFSKTSGAPSLISSTGFGSIKIRQKPNIIVSKDGKGHFTRITDAIASAPSYSSQHFVILVKKGIYKEYVNIDITKSNIVLIGEGMNSTVIYGSKSRRRGYQTFETATFGVNAQGFVAIDIWFANTAGQNMGQAVALLSAGDRSVFYRCKITGNQDTLLVQSGRQFFRECQIIGTIDFIFGYGTAVFQKCNIYIRKNHDGGTSVVAAHGRSSPTDPTGFSFQYCLINGDPQSLADPYQGAYLGRSWGTYSRTVVMLSYISNNVLRPEGWVLWNGNFDKFYFGEYMNSGPGAALGGRVKWPGYHKMAAADAYKFTVAKFIDGNSWLPWIGVPYMQGLA